MKRRQFITFLGGAALWPLAAPAQQPAMRTVGWLHSASAEPYVRMMAAFLDALGEHGFVEGRNVRIEARWAEGHYDRLPELAADLVRMRADVLAVPGSDVAAIAAKGATTTIPIVFMIGGDPVKDGLVASLNRPGGNATGFSIFTSLLAVKRLEMLRELVPNAALIGMLANPDNSTAETDIGDVQEAVRALGQQVSVVRARTEGEIDAAFDAFAGQRVAAVLVNTDPFYVGQREQLAALAIRHALPAMFSLREHAEAGGLMSYGTDLVEAYRQLGHYTGQILAGAKPADMPVQQPTKFELLINLKTAKSLGLDIPPPLLVRADDVIE